MPYINVTLQEFLRTDDYTFRFSDKLDRLYIAKGSFDLNLVFSEDPIHKSSGLIAVLDTESGHVVPHYIAEPGNMRLIWRTVVQVKDSKDTRAVGFRLLAYTDGRLKIKEAHPKKPV